MCDIATYRSPKASESAQRAMTTGSTCLICSEPAYASIDNKLLTSEQCGHQVCRRCLQFNQQRQNDDAATTANSSTKNGPSQKVARLSSSAGRSQGLTCPLCQIMTVTEDWVDRSLEDSIFEQEKLIRQRVSSVYNCNRRNFDTTPLYNDYLEMREETIYELSFGRDENKRKILQKELQSAEIQNQKQIVESKQSALQEQEEEIRRIVAKEGVFYQIVAENYGPGFQYAKALENHLVHPLEREYPELFVRDDFESSSNRDTASSSSQLGSGGQPKPIQIGLIYEKIARKQPTDRAAMFRACGHFKERLGQRVSQELWGGLSFELIRIK